MPRPVLQDILNNCEGALANVVMGFDGIAVEQASRDSDFDVQAVGMEFSFVLSQVRKAAEILDVGGLEEVSVRSGKLTFLVRVLSDDHFIGMALAPDGNLGKGRYLMRVAVPKLLEAL